VDTVQFDKIDILSNVITVTCVTYKFNKTFLKWVEFWDGKLSGAKMREGIILRILSMRNIIPSRPCFTRIASRTHRYSRRLINM